MTKLENLKFVKGSRHKSKLFARGFGSGRGKTAGRGSKGQNSRNGGGVRLGFEGGQTPLYRKLPKFGFSNYQFSHDYNVVTTDELVNLNVNKIDKAILVKNRIIKDNKLPLKIIKGKKELTSAIEVITNKITEGAKMLIENAKGSVKNS